jgi:hypothetical protein
VRLKHHNDLPIHGVNHKISEVMISTKAEHNPVIAKNINIGNKIKGNNKLIRYTRACDMYRDFLYRAKLLSQKLLSQGYVQP